MKILSWEVEGVDGTRSVGVSCLLQNERPRNTLKKHGIDMD